MAWHLLREDAELVQWLLITMPLWLRSGNLDCRCSTTRQQARTQWCQQRLQLIDAVGAKWNFPARPRSGDKEETLPQSNSAQPPNNNRYLPSSRETSAAALRKKCTQRKIRLPSKSYRTALSAILHFRAFRFPYTVSERNIFETTTEVLI